MKTPRLRAALRSMMIEHVSGSDELARLTTLRLFGVLDEATDLVLDRVTVLAAAAFGVSVAVVVVTDAKREHVASAYGIDAAHLSDISLFFERTLAANVVTVACDVANDFCFYAAAPLRRPDGTKIGVLCLLDALPRRFSSANVELLERFADVAYAHIDQERESRDAVASRNQLHAIIQASPFAIVTTRFDGGVTTWNESAERLFGWTAEEAIGRRSPIVPSELGRQSAAMRARVERGELIRAMPSYRRHKDGRRMEIEISGAPVRGPLGEIVEGVYILEDVTAVVRERANERNRYEILELAANDAPIQVLLDRLVANVELAVPGTICTIVRVQVGRLYTAAFGRDISPQYLAAIDGLEIGPTVGSCGAAAYLNEPVIVGDIETHPNWEPYRDLARAAQLRACWSVPIRAAAGAIATMACYAREPRMPTDSELRALYEAAHVASIVLEGHDARNKLRTLAMHDALTGLPNRTFFELRLREVIAQAKQTGKRAAIGLLDLDRFKIVNDSLGHAVGDQLLVEVASRLERSLRDEDTVARMGGDEFMILIANVDDRESAYAIGQRLLGSLRNSFAPGGNELFLRASLGLAIYPDDAVEESQLLRLADHAMYEAKAIGSTIVCHNGERESDGLTQLALETYLYRAVDNEEFELAYQPIVNLCDGSTFSAEALLRWTHPKLGRLAPDRFIGLAEETGLIIPIGAWVLKEACRFSKRWSLAGGSGRVTVNVSPRQFEERSFVQTVVDAIRESAIAPGNLYLEITEGLIMRSPETVSTILAELRALGVRSVIDDFGSGYSSLGYLKRFPIEALKIDRTFVSEIGSSRSSASDEAIVHAIVAVGKALGLGVVAEGVETEAQAAFLRDAGCALAQGYYFGRPMPEQDLLQWVVRSPSHSDVHR